MAKRNRYKEMEQLMATLLIAAAVIFVLYLIVAGAEILWLKVLLAILEFLICGGSLAFLYMTKELLKQRSLWLSSGFFSILLCLIAALVFAFPG